MYGGCPYGGSYYNTNQLPTSSVRIYCIPRVHSTAQVLVPNHFAHLCIYIRTVLVGVPFRRSRYTHPRRLHGNAATDQPVLVPRARDESSAEAAEAAGVDGSEKALS